MKNTLIMEKFPHETQRMFERRKEVFDNALAEGESEAKALVYANVWANIEFLKAEYDPQLEHKARQYAPSQS